MQPNERDTGYVFDMLQFAREALDLAANVAINSPLDQIRSRRALERTISLIGEAANNGSREFQRAHSEIPWSEIIGQRNWLVHGYRDIELRRIRDVVDNRLQPLIAQLVALLPEPPSDPEPEES